MIFVNNPGSGGGGGGSSDTQESTQLLVKAAVQSIAADNSTEATLVQVRNAISTLNGAAALEATQQNVLTQVDYVRQIVGTIRQNLDYTLGYHNTGLVVIPCGVGGSYSVNYVIGAYEDGVGWVSDPAKFTGLLPHEEMHIRDVSGRFVRLAFQPLAVNHLITTAFNGFYIAI